MAEIYYYCFILICIGMLGWGLIRLERVYQYPFFMAAIFVSFILPQAATLIEKQTTVSNITDGGLEKVMLYACMCAAMCWLGYQRYQPQEKWLSKLDIDLNKNKLFQIGCLFLLIGCTCQFLLTKIEIQRSAINNSWTGPATILAFFSGFLVVALPIFLLSALMKPNFINIAMTIVSAAPIMLTIIVSGRRTPTITLLITIGIAYYLTKKYIPPRWIFVAAVIGAVFVIPLLGALRGDFWALLFSGDLQALVDTSNSSLAGVKKQDILELRNAALIINAVDSNHNYALGTGFWNSIVFQYVPGQIVGFDVKRSLQFGANFDLKALYGYVIPNGSTYTGLGDSFAEFGYFGCLIFWAIARLFKTLWISMVSRQSVFSALFYIGIVSPAMLGITHGIGVFLQQLIFQVCVMFLVAKYAGISSQQHDNLFKKGQIH